MGRPRSWTDDDLRRAIAVASSWSDVARALGLTPTGRSRELVRQRAWALGLLTSHFDATGGVMRPAVPLVVEGTQAERRERNRSARRWTDAELADAVRDARSWADVHRNLGIVIGGTTYRMLQRRGRELGLDTSHLRGQGWAKGMANPSRVQARPLAELLVRDSDYSTHELRLRLIRAGLKVARCEGCQLEQWRGQPIPLQLDHINGIRSDNRLENLRILCPNCHAQTDTWCGKNIGRPVV